MSLKNDTGKIEPSKSMKIRRLWLKLVLSIFFQITYNPIHTHTPDVEDNDGYLTNNRVISFGLVG